MKWISVKDRLPEEGIDCLIWVSKDDGAHIASRGNFLGADWEEDACCCNRSWNNEQVSHWMYYSDIPKPKSD